MNFRNLWIAAGLSVPLLVGADTDADKPKPGTAVAAASSIAPRKAILDQYCVGCHNDKAKVANLSLQNSDLATVGDHPDKWEKVIRKMRAGMMPPPGMRRPLRSPPITTCAIGWKRAWMRKPERIPIRVPWCCTG